jgi:biopolymer transport protein ExbD
MGADVGGSGGPKSEPNVVPLCDILLVLLIIFMVITPLLKKGANLTLPEASHVADQPESSNMVTVHIKKDGGIVLDDKVLEETDLNKFVQMLEDKLEEKKQSENIVAQSGC